MVKSDQDCPEHQRLWDCVPTEPKDSSRIPFRIDLDDLYGGEHYAKEIFAVPPGGIFLFIGRLTSEFHMINGAALVTVEP